MSAQIHFPQGPINDPNTNTLSLEWFMFLQELTSGIAFLFQAAQASSGFATTMLSMAEDDQGADSMMGMIPGPRGLTGERGTIGPPGMDTEQSDDCGMLFPPGTPSATGATTTITTASLVGKTITVTNGVITNFS